MPTVLRTGAYTFFFYSSDGNEPHHIHVRRENAVAKFWLMPICLYKSRNFNDHELRKLHKIVKENQNFFLEVWNEYFSD